ncbi:MAG: aminotransferase class I/II-fold pyridoxal phosphate-dependent enzyme [Bacteroidota bacterium]|nr:aminotransferase class I/II-fold pyridoxal phosphate-dependent enzyme [Bacteroidota bacterium]
MNFSSENFAGVHPAIMQALEDCNKGYAPSYGNDPFTEESIDAFKEIFGNDIDVFFCFNGTGANNFAISSMTEKHQSVFCSDVAHLYVDESTAPEAFTGNRLYPIKSLNGKMLPDDFKQQVKRIGDVHHPQPGVLSLTLPTEYGTVYQLDELEQISAVCKENNIMLHIDGARIFNALESLNCSFKDLLEASKMDALSLGGTKSGMMFGEGVVFFNTSRFKYLKYNHKRSMQLASKNRFIAAQFKALLQNELWKNIAAHTNGLAKEFEQQLRQIDDNLILHPVETNMVFLRMKENIYSEMKKDAHFYLWDARKEETRFVFSFSNNKSEIDAFMEKFRRLRK